MNNIVLRGTKKINKVIMRKIKDNMVEKNGTYVKKDIWVLDTVGSNLIDILALDFIDFSKTFSNDIIETYNIFGIEAARQAIYNELVDVIEFDGTYVNAHHLGLLCDRMTYTNKMISIFRHGINNDNIGPIAKASFEETPEMFLRAARHGELDMMHGVSANIMCGQEGAFGTNSFQVYLDMNEMQKVDEAVKYDSMTQEERIESIYVKKSVADECDANNLIIQNNVNNMKTVDGGGDDDYNPGF
jgi:DNA-directed RNA polymerase II subunit RPB1